jgi:hypothetical protein
MRPLLFGALPFPSANILRLTGMVVTFIIPRPVGFLSLPNPGPTELLPCRRGSFYAKRALINRARPRATRLGVCDSHGESFSLSAIRAKSGKDEAFIFRMT